MGQGRARVFNLLTLIVLIATVVFGLWVVLRLSQPPPERVEAQVVVPTVQQLPTVTPTNTPTNTPLPTFTPSPTAVPPTIPPTTTPTFTPVPIVPTVAPSLTPVPTNTPVPPSPTGTLIPTIAPSATVTLTLPATATSSGPQITQQATVPPPSPFPFTLKDGQVIFTQNFANAAGCSWQGIGGQVFDVNNAPFTQVRVHVFGSGLDTFAQAGTNSLYGPSGWEIAVGSNLSGNVYQVELQSLNGTIISQPVTVAFTANDCARNLALVNFVATRPF
ncbi:MAG TPA: hypothetical protein VER79_03850 [Candidatus Limnocylindrales bacterium]|nr:hypothetical protein [Candidatus Limnocylindrales bacterium]